MAKPIKQCNLAELSEIVSACKLPAFRKKQLLEWLYRRQVSSYSQISNLPASFISYLSENHPLVAPTIFNKQVSKDGTRKYLITLSDGSLVETVAIPSSSGKRRLTVCFSTQVGCPMKCSFCATGHEGFTRNLGMGEIIDQIAVVQSDFNERVTNLVGMGQGEPFLNIENTLDALSMLNNEKFFNIGARHITVSTCGVIPGIARFGEDTHQYTLAVSLHSAIQSTRDEIMPMVSSFPLADLKSALEDYLAATNRRVTFEYLLIKGVNDSSDHLDALISYTSDLLCHVNLLNMNSIGDSPYKSCSSSTVDTWLRSLQRAGVETSIRISRGSDIYGACGQLKNSIM